MALSAQKRKTTIAASPLHTQHNIKKNTDKMLVTPSLEKFLSCWDNKYKEHMQSIPMFNPENSKKWDKVQQQFFVKAFYHIRGHFHQFLWEMGNFAPNSETKEMILNNIRDEFGKSGLSHEKLYFMFAETVGVNLEYEIIEEKSYLPFIQEYINGQIKWL